MEIRRLDVKDAESVAILSNKNKEFFQYEVNAEFLTQFVNYPGFVMFVGEEKGEIVGFCGARYGEGSAELGPLCVNEKYRKKGVAGKLLETVVDFVNANGAKKMIVKVKENNETGITFFKKHGFHDKAMVDCCGPAKLFIKTLR